MAMEFLDNLPGGLLEGTRDFIFPGYVERSNQRRYRNRLYKIAHRIDHKLPQYILLMEEIHRVQGDMERENSPEAIKAYQEATGKWDNLYRRNESMIERVEIMRESTPWYSFSERNKLDKMQRRVEKRKALMDYATTLWHEYTLRDRTKEIRTRRAVIGTLVAAGALYFLHQNPDFFSNVVNNVREGYEAIRNRPVTTGTQTATAAVGT